MPLRELAWRKHWASNTDRRNRDVMMFFSDDSQNGRSTRSAIDHKMTGLQLSERVLAIAEADYLAICVCTFILIDCMHAKTPIASTVSCVYTDMHKQGL